MGIERAPFSATEVTTDDLRAASGLVDGSNLLTGAMPTQYLGTRGCEVQ